MEQQLTDKVVIEEDSKLEMTQTRINIIAIWFAWLVCISYFSPYYGVSFLVLLGFVFNQILLPISIVFFVDFIKERRWKKSDNRLFVKKIWDFLGTSLNWIFGVLIVSSSLFLIALNTIAIYSESVFNFFREYIPFSEYVSQIWFGHLMIYFLLFIFVFISAVLLLVKLREKFRALDILENIESYFIKDVSQIN